MVELLTIGAALALLYFWLIGHWFARILVFLGLLGIAAFAGLITGLDGHGAGGLGILVFLIGAGLSWPLASIPIYYWRYRLGYPSKLREYIEYERP